jgi:hypothetical protein
MFWGQNTGQSAWEGQPATECQPKAAKQDRRIEPGPGIWRSHQSPSQSHGHLKCTGKAAHSQRPELSRWPCRERLDQRGLEKTNRNSHEGQKVHESPPTVNVNRSSSNSQTGASTAGKFSLHLSPPPQVYLRADPPHPHPSTHEGQCGLYNQLIYTLQMDPLTSRQLLCHSPSFARANAPAGILLQGEVTLLRLQTQGTYLPEHIDYKSSWTSIMGSNRTNHLQVQKQQTQRNHV